ncbi:hypothetical protein MMC25_000592 [Agyrium rufum]|nr:hypothetical protein [Agyrium rufum]
MATQAVPTEVPGIQADTEERQDDSAYESEAASYTTSLSSTVTDYKYEHGRRYHAYKEGSYVYPNDEKESDRLDIVHKMIEVIHHGRLYIAPVENPNRVLDIGTGTGIWAIEFGDKFPNCEVLGNDLSPIQSRWVPPNVSFEVDDVEEEWTYSKKFDFIHCRCMSICIKDWPRLISKAFEFTNPGGFVEFADFDLEWKSPDKTLAPDSAGKVSNDEFLRAARDMIGKEPSPGPHLKKWVEDAGFVDVQHSLHPIPIGTWPADKHLKEIGAWNFLQIMEGLEGFCYAIFSRMLGYTKEEVDVLCAKIRSELRDPKQHVLVYLYLETLFPCIVAGISITHLLFGAVRRNLARRKHRKDGRQSPSIHPNGDYRDQSGETTAVGSIEEEENDIGDGGEDAALLRKMVSDPEKAAVVNRPKGQRTILIIEFVSTLGEVFVHAHALAATGHGAKGSRVTYAAGTAIWTYLLVLVLLRFVLAYTKRISIPHIWGHSVFLYIFLWLTTVMPFRSVLINPHSRQEKNLMIANFVLVSVLMVLGISQRKGNRAVILIHENGIRPSRQKLASLLSLATFAWVDTIVLDGYKKQFEIKDIWNLLPKDRALNIIDDFRQLQKTTKLAWHFMRYFKRLLILQMSWAILSSLITFIPTLLLKAILEYVERPDEVSVHSAWLYVILLAVTGVVSAIADGQALWIGRAICINTRAIVIGEVYSKTLRRRAAAGVDKVLGGKVTNRATIHPPKGILGKLKSVFSKKEQNRDAVEGSKKDAKKDDKDATVNTGTIINLMAVDASKASEVAAYLHFLFPSTPIEIVIAVYLLWTILGYSAIASLVIMVALMPLQVVIARQFNTTQKRIMAATDGRIHVSNEVLQNIRIIKYFAWEERFAAKVNEKRAIEIQAIRSRFILWTFASVVWYGVPLLITASSFLIYTLVEKKDLIPSIAFTALSLFNLLRYPLDRIADMLAHIQEAKVSIDRVEEFLNEDETEKFDQLKPEPEYDENGDVRLGLEHATLGWGGRHENEEIAAGEEDAQAFRLINMTIKFLPGRLNLIAGPTGSGKSSLLMGLLGEMTLKAGTVHFPGGYNRQELRPDPETGLTESVAYCAQQAWLVNDTIKQNIVFAAPFDRKRYDAVIEACALKRDLEVLDAGDSTLVGEKGIVVSGGQKQRISLARALYSNARHVLLDDCLSAVDSHTAQHIFEKCICGPLMQKRTCILVTHNIALCLPQSDFVVVLGNGKIAAQGGPDEVLNSGALGEDMRSRPGSKGGTRAPSPAPSGNANGDASASKANGLANSTEDALSTKKSNVLEDEDDVNANARTEKIAQGGAKWHVVNTYLSSMGPWYYWFFVLVGFMLEQLGSVSTNVWIRQWANSYSTTSPDTMSIGSGAHSASAPYAQGALLTGGSLAYGFHMPSLVGNSSETYDVTSEGSSSGSDPVYYLSVYIVLGIIYILTFVFKLGVMFKGSLNASRNIHRRLLNSVLRATFGFFDRTPLGQITNRFSKDLETIDNDVLLTASGVLQSLFALTTIIILISVITPGFLVAAAILGTAYFGVGLFYVQSSRDLKRLESAQRSPIYQQFGETLSGVTTIRAYGDEKRFIEENASRVDTYNRPFIYLWACNRWLALRVDLAGALVSFAAALLVIMSVGTVDAGAAGLSLTYAVMFNENILWLVRLWATTEQNVSVIERVKEYLDVEQEAPASIPETKPPGAWPSKGELKFEEYSTRYRADLDPVLKKLSFEVKGEEKVGIVGRTGAGKSSLAMALFRGLEATEGKIFLDGIDIGTIGLQNLREAITIVPQDPTLFMGTIRSNLDPFDLFTDEEIFTALRNVHLIGDSVANAATAGSSSLTVFGQKPNDSTLTPPRSPSLLPGEEPSDLETDAPSAEAELAKVMTNTRENANVFLNLSSTISESGSNLSQGQRQLLCLARALLKAPRVLVMDEATASIDYATDAKIQETLREVKGSTIITIAHRLQTIVDYDKVLVLDKGEVVEFAEPWDLIEREGGIFRGMCEMSGDFQTLREGARKVGEKKRLVDI